MTPQTITNIPRDRARVALQRGVLTQAKPTPWSRRERCLLALLALLSLMLGMALVGETPELTSVDYARVAE